MPFTNIWSVVIPAGATTQAKLIDDHIRQLRLDLQERFNATLFKPSEAGDPDDPQPNAFLRDPLVLKDEVSGKKKDKVMIIHYAEAIKNTLGKEFVFDQYKMTAFTDTAPIYYPIHLPPGVTLKRVEVMNDKIDAGSVVIRVLKRQFLAGAALNDNVQIATVTNLVAGRVISAPADFAEVIAADFMYYIEIEATGTAGNGFAIMGIRLTYDSPTHQTTL
jgi:hypothetical protein